MASPLSRLSFHASSFIVAILIFCMSHCALGIDGQTVIDSPLLTEKLGINRTEKVHIPENKPYIFMRGNGKGKTAIVWSQSSEDNVASATFKVEAHDFIAFGISFKRVTIKGSVTAQNRESEGEMSGFIFIKGKVYDIGGVYLGRAKGPYSRVIFAETYLSMTIVPEG
ncbi:hypothetical protein JHK82_044134 [Glycine max]|nr:hypothetical protein JHK86_042314 [Glycine max]KAG4956557.1 hypothetical protein JHK85_042937 [Glycine max]KAG5105298.1 hypothetical protein JHK82_042268 [Glycine max]KAG5107162.1 hypothetical protein JHK82_044132 [Glycine max]KAG5107163.1 hypothetical protein JHK82_044133 [Glycine max]